MLTNAQHFGLGVKEWLTYAAVSSTSPSGFAMRALHITHPCMAGVWFQKMLEPVNEADVGGTALYAAETYDKGKELYHHL